jgi:hypothetical protein
MSSRELRSGSTVDYGLCHEVGLVLGRRCRPAAAGIIATAKLTVEAPDPVEDSALKSTVTGETWRRVVHLAINARWRER